MIRDGCIGLNLREDATCGPLRSVAAPLISVFSLMTRVLQQGEAVFMHDLRAVRGEDCDAAVLLAGVYQARGTWKRARMIS